MIPPSVADAMTAAITWLRMCIEGIGALWIGVGFVYAVASLIRVHLLRQTASFTLIRLTFSRYLSLALEFQLAADILSTSVAPSWQELGKLGATAVIRTALNYFLTREIREYRTLTAEPATASPAGTAPALQAAPVASPTI